MAWVRVLAAGLPGGGLGGRGRAASIEQGAAARLEVASVAAHRGRHATDATLAGHARRDTSADGASGERDRRATGGS